MFFPSETQVAFHPYPCPVAVPHARVPLPCRLAMPHRPCPPTVRARRAHPLGPRGRAPWCGPVAVGRDVPIAPPRHSAVRGLACAPWCGMAVRTVAWAPVVTGRRALRGYRGRTETPQQNSQRVLLAIFHAHYPGGAMGTSRPTAITPAWGAPPFPTRITRAARCLAAGPPGSRRRAPARCAALHPAHAESFACRGSVRGTVRGRAAHPPRRRHSPVAARHSRPAVGPPDPGRKKRKRGNVLRFPPFRVYRRSIAR